MKICSRCKRELPIECFCKNRWMKNGLNSYCRECRAQYHKKYYGDNRAKIKQRNKKYNRDHQTEINRQHREYRRTIRGHLGQVFHDMDRRCNDPTVCNYPRYGGRGIRNKFGSVGEFLDHVTSILQVDPRGLQIDRINNNGHYEKGNIRFVTAKENSNNRRNSR